MSVTELLTSIAGNPISSHIPPVCLDDSVPHAASVQAISNAEPNTFPNDLVPIELRSASVQPYANRETTQNHPLAFHSNDVGDAARLMDGFQLESMVPGFDVNGINAAQLMQDFNLEPFSFADHANAAQLMQQFDWFSGDYLQHL